MVEVLNPEFNEAQWEDICISVVENFTPLKQFNYKYDPDGQGYRYVFDYGNLLSREDLINYGNDVMQRYPRILSEFMVHMRIINYKYLGREWHAHPEAYCQRCGFGALGACNMAKAVEIILEHRENCYIMP